MQSIYIDIKHEIQIIDKSAKSIRKFGFILAGLFVAVSAFLLYKENSIWIVFAISGFITAIISFLIPKLLTPIYLILTVFSTVIGYFVSKIILSLMFIIFFVPVGLFTRLVGKDLLNKKIDRSSTTYWLKKETPAPPKEQYERLF